MLVRPDGANAMTVVFFDTRTTAALWRGRNGEARTPTTLLVATELVRAQPFQSSSLPVPFWERRVPLCALGTHRVPP
jgi:hypothetical protein